jgi:glutathione synthase/RimK-type ligase-like ATP-grasp enzyme
MTMLGLKFATVDIKESRDGTLYFLELNPQGQFLYVEILTGLPIAVAMAKYLTGLDAQGG